MKGKLSILDPLPGDYAENSEKFKSMVASYSDGNFLLIPARGNKVRIIHHCFVQGDPGGTTVVVGISGMRRTSPFKTVNVAHAVALITKPRATRGGGNDISFLPSVDEFLGCENPKDFETLTPEDKDFPASILREQAQSFWLHPLVLETHRSGQLTWLSPSCRS
jgi:hypothetical protein